MLRRQLSSAWPRVHAARHAPWLRRAASWLGVLTVLTVGGSLGATLAPGEDTTLGPLRLHLSVVPTLHPGVALLIPPVGRVAFDTHRSPVAVHAEITQVDPDEAKTVITSAAALQDLQDRAPDVLRAAAERAALSTAVCALAGAVVLGLLVYRLDGARIAEVAGGLVGVLVATAGVTAATFDADRLAQPQFTGLLSRAPYVASTAGSIADRLQTYRAGLADLVRSVTTVYATSAGLPVVPDGDRADVVKVLHVSDIHLNPIAYDLIDRLVKQFGVDFVIDTGDITTWGTGLESSTLSRIRGVGVPYVFVRGNHDSRATQAAVRAIPGAVVLDGTVRTVDGVVVAGIGDPVFTPDASQDVAAPSGGAEPAPSRPVAPPPVSASASASASASESGEPTPGRSDPENPLVQRQLAAGDQLARIIGVHDEEHQNAPVTIAAVHDPAAAPALDGQVPLVLAGHLHQRSTSVTDGTRLMVEGSTGGSGITAGAFDRAREGQPVPLSATILYLARAGDRAGQLLAYDSVTVGGFGLASVSLQRTVVRPEDTPQPTPSPSSSLSSSSSSTLSTSSPSSSLHPVPSLPTPSLPAQPAPFSTPAPTTRSTR